MTFNYTFYTNFPKFSSFVFLFGVIYIFSPNVLAQDFVSADASAKDIVVTAEKKDLNKKVLKANTLSNTPTTQIIQNETPTIVKKGETLNIRLDNPKNEKIIVRVHSSLGRLVKEFPEVKEGFLMPTTTLLAGLYLVIIKRQNIREIRKVLVTE